MERRRIQGIKRSDVETLDRVRRSKLEFYRKRTSELDEDFAFL